MVNHHEGIETHTMGEAQNAKERSRPRPQSFLPDLPLPTPPPMPDIQMTSRLADHHLTRPTAVRRFTNSRSTEFGRSPILSRTQAFGTSFSNRPDIRRESSLSQIRRDPLEGLKRTHTRTLDDIRTCGLPNFQPNLQTYDPNKSKYLGKDTDLTQELEEVKNLSHELQSKFGEFHNQNYDYVYFNEHYMSDIDENEEVKEFFRRHSDSSQGDYGQAVSTLKVHKSLRMPSPILVRRGDFHDSLSSLKSSEFSPCLSKRLDFDLEVRSPNVLKSPCRTVVKLAKIR